MNRLLVVFILMINFRSFAQEPSVTYEYSIFSKYSMGMFNAFSMSKAGSFLDVKRYAPNLPPPSSFLEVIFDNRLSLSLEYSFMNTKGTRDQFARVIEPNTQYQSVRPSEPYNAFYQLTNYRIKTHLFKLGINRVKQNTTSKQKKIGANFILGFSRMKDMKIGIATIGTNETIVRNYKIKPSPILGLSFPISTKILGTSYTTAKKTHQTADSFGIEPMIWTTLNRVQYDEYNFFTHQEKTVNYRVFNFHYGFQIHYTFSNRIMGRKRVI